VIVSIRRAILVKCMKVSNNRDDFFLNVSFQ
jgi:hypothetical protein